MKIIRFLLLSFGLFLVFGVLAAFISIVLERVFSIKDRFLPFFISFLCCLPVFIFMVKYIFKKKPTIIQGIEKTGIYIEEEIDIKSIVQPEKVEYVTDDIQVIPSHASDSKIQRKYLYPRKDLEDTSHFFYGKKVVISGVFDAFPYRAEMAKMLWEVGADVDTSIGKKTDVLIKGEECGPVKLKKAKDQGIKIINEEKFLSYFPDYSLIF